MVHAPLTFLRATTKPVLSPQSIETAEAVISAVGRVTQEAIRYRTAVGHVMEGVPTQVAAEVAQRYGLLALGERLPLADAAAWPPLADACRAALGAYVPAARSLAEDDRDRLAFAIPAVFRHAVDPREPVADRLALSMLGERIARLATPHDGGERPDPLVAARSLGRMVSGTPTSTWLDATDPPVAALLTSLWAQVELLSIAEPVWQRSLLDRLAAAWSFVSRTARIHLLDPASHRDLAHATAEAALLVLPRAWPELWSATPEEWQRVACVGTVAFMAARQPRATIPGLPPAAALDAPDDGAWLTDRYRSLAALADEPHLRRIQWAGWIVGLRLAHEAGERVADLAPVTAWPMAPDRTT